ncbi:hypothetical protein [Spirosoma radiotolerans]|uniref:Uncharacterized protein n=1 Tax=Spirosoma radiotolerans TaxID=1379870 RepID=A0A0E3ZVA8_9BACT|nr:hypothetical protein [Spirosoma radiotolerans]AKD55018.1 hypothetical protein SD10_08995 [Spirosoma radiotolerans]
MPFTITPKQLVQFKKLVNSQPLEFYENASLYNSLAVPAKEIIRYVNKEYPGEFASLYNRLTNAQDGEHLSIIAMNQTGTLKKVLNLYEQAYQAELMEELSEKEIGKMNGYEYQLIMVDMIRKVSELK